MCDFCKEFCIAIISKTLAEYMIVYLKTLTHRQCFNIFVHYSIKTDETLSEDVIISSHAVQSDVECSMKCLEKSPTCVGYNDRSKSNRYAVNCQLSNKTREKDQATGANKKWAFYQNLEEVRIKICYLKSKFKNLVGKI